MEWNKGNVRGLVEDARAVIAPQSIAHILPQGNSSALKIVDLYNPRLAECLYEYEPTATGLASFGRQIGQLWRALSTGDLFICGNRNQMLYYAGMLSLNGRLNPSTPPNPEELLLLVPPGVPPESPHHDPGVIRGNVVAEDDRVVLWYGGMYPWYDVDTLFQAMVRVFEKVSNARLVVIGKNPVVTVPTYTLEYTRELQRRLSADSNIISFLDWLPYAKRSSYLLEADLGVNAHKPGLEAALACRSRLNDFFWCGVPLVTTDGDHTSEYVKQWNAGTVVPPENPKALSEAIIDLLLDDSRRAESARKSRELGQGPLSWDSVIKPLDRTLNLSLDGETQSPGFPEPGRISPLRLSRARYLLLKHFSLLMGGMRELRDNPHVFWENLRLVLGWR